MTQDACSCYGTFGGVRPVCPIHDGQSVVTTTATEPVALATAAANRKRPSDQIRERANAIWATHGNAEEWWCELQAVKEHLDSQAGFPKSE